MNLIMFNYILYKAYTVYYLDLSLLLYNNNTSIQGIVYITGVHSHEKGFTGSS